MTSIQWEALAAISQLIAGLGTLLAAWFAFMTVRQMREDSRLLRKEFTANFGAQMRISWAAEDRVNPVDVKPKFPSNSAQVDSLEDASANLIFTTLSTWWSSPSRNACPMKYVVLSIHNTQANYLSGAAQELCGEIEMQVKNPYPPYDPLIIYSVFDFSLGDCAAGQSHKIPIRVEGAPQFAFKIISLTYLSENGDRTTVHAFGNQEYIFNPED